MKKNNILAFVLAGTMLFSIPAYAAENNSFPAENIPIEKLNPYNLDINKDNAFKKLEQTTQSIKDFETNKMERFYEGDKLNITDIPNKFSARSNEENTDPNNAYLVENGNIVQGNLTKKGEMRWYGFIANQTSKASIMLQSVAAVDADIYLFKLNQDTGVLDLIGGSANQGLGISEYSSNILDAGIYYFAISSYEGNGQYAFAFYETNDLSNEVNDSVSTAATVSVNSKISGVIDNPYDQDYYTFTLSSPVVMNMSSNVGNYKFQFLAVDSNAKIYKISQKETMYQFDAGTYYFAVYSADNTFDVNKTYTIDLNKITNVSDNSKAFYFMVNEAAKIVFQSDPYGKNMYVNGNPIDISYSYYHKSSNSGGSQSYDIKMNNSPNLQAKIYENQFIFDKWETTVYYGMGMPDTVYYSGGSKGVGPEGNALQLSVYTANPEKFYNIYCICSGAYAANTYYNDLEFATVFINPNTGKLVDIQRINYFYDIATGSNSMSYTRPHSRSTKYYYPYYNGELPSTW